MTLVECSLLLAFIAELDYRKFTDATVEAWHEVLGRYGLDEAKAAVVRHYNEDEPDFLKPNHITSQIKSVRRKRLAGVTRVEVADVDDPRGPNASRSDFDAYQVNRERVREAIESGQVTRAEYQMYLAGSVPWSEFSAGLSQPRQLT